MKRLSHLCRYLILARDDVTAELLAGRDRHSVRQSLGEDRMTSEDVLVPTEADQLRQQLLQAQRLSSVGALASSVAHEFNNILTTIINYAKLALRPEADEPNRTQALEKILKGSQRAATIVSSMLGFARNGSTQRQMTDLIA
jgi:signal transduction histidine kinase